MNNSQQKKINGFLIALAYFYHSFSQIFIGIEFKYLQFILLIAILGVLFSL